MEVLKTVVLPAAPPLTGWLVAGFVLLATGLAFLTVRRGRAPLASAESTRRAGAYVLVYTLCAACFTRVIGPALLGLEDNAWLLALGDVIFVTFGLFVWVMILSEGHRLTAYGLRWAPAGRLIIPMLMGLAAVVYFGYRPYFILFSGIVQVTADGLVFALLFAALGSALPEELLFRGYLMGSLEGSSSRFARIIIPALLFTLMRAVRYAPGAGLGTMDWMSYILSVALPLGLLWGLMRELAAGTLWPGLISHFLLEFGTTLYRTSPASS